MADIPASNWDETDANNTTAAPDGAPEGMSPSGVNNVLRAHQGAIKRWYDWTIPKTTGGTSTAYTLSYTVTPGALVDGMTHLVQFNATCGASPTLNVNSLGDIPLHYYTAGAWAVVPAGGLTANMVAEVSYNSAAGTYRIVNSSIPVAQGLLAQTVAADGYQNLLGGTTIQWGTETVGGPITVAFPVAFSATPYSVQITASGNSGPLNNGSHSATSVTTTGFLLTNGGTNSIPFYWFAVGPT
jgi:hypothetical protein